MSHRIAPPLGGALSDGWSGSGKTIKLHLRYLQGGAGPLKDIHKLSYNPSKWHYKSVIRLITPIYTVSGVIILLIAGRGSPCENVGYLIYSIRLSNVYTLHTCRKYTVPASATGRELFKPTFHIISLGLQSFQEPLCSFRSRNISIGRQIE